MRRNLENIFKIDQKIYILKIKNKPNHMINSKEIKIWKFYEGKVEFIHVKVEGMPLVPLLLEKNML